MSTTRVTRQSFKLLSKGRYRAAEKLSLEITQDYPEDQFAWKVLGAVLGAVGRKTEALNVNQTAVTLFLKMLKPIATWVSH